VGRPGWFGETALGSSLHSTEAQLISSYPSSFLGMLKIFIFFFLIAHFFLVKNTYKNSYSLKAVKASKVIPGLRDRSALMQLPP
jgi:hypothetical protein